jgi:HSP20 family protein
MIAPQQEQIVPVRVYQSGERLMAIMPLPGLEPPDISVTVRGDQVVVRGEYRGPHQQDLDLLIAEWAIGPYHRELHLPQAVDGARTNATYGNGVLVLVMPRLAQGERPQDTEFRLEVLAAARGAHVGHTGHDLHQTTMAEHRQRQEQAEQAAHASAAPSDSGDTQR